MVPDPVAWGLWGEDLEARGLSPVAAPAAAAVLLVPATIPQALEEAVREAWEEMAPPRRLVQLESPALPGRPVRAVLDLSGDAGPGGEPRGSGEGGEQGEESEGEDGGGEENEEHDHGDMMEITGEPSRDGLVMESIELEHGPLAPALPGGLVLAAELDGDVIAGCEVRAELRARDHADHGLAMPAPDPLAATAWSVALGRAAGVLDPVSPRAVAAVEWERAVSHQLWLESFAAIVGWDELGHLARRAARPLIAARRAI
ncbi:MAG TPA: hypothetical protein VGR10_01635, partial [Thermoleophilaceae bacterium]|nr:hypothetical protein [Thermoleophilaceae bacterium]